MAATTMAFRVAQLQELAHTDAQKPCSPPSLLYESPSNHKVTADSTKEEAADQPLDDSPWGPNQTQDPPVLREDSTGFATASPDAPSPQDSSSTANHVEVSGRPMQGRRISGHRVVRSNSTGKVPIRRRAACPVSTYSEAVKHHRFASTCPASDASGGEAATIKQRFLNIFEDENSPGMDCSAAVAADAGSVRLHPRSLMQDAGEIEAVAPDEDTTSGSTDRPFLPRSAFRRGSFDSSRVVQNRHYRSEYRSSEANRESSSESSTDAVPVKPSRNVRRSPRYYSSSETSMYGSRKCHVQSDEEREEQQQRVAFSPPRYDNLPSSYGKKGRHMRQGEASYPHLLCSHDKPALLSSTTAPVVAGTVTPSVNSSTTSAAPPCASATATASSSTRTAPSDPAGSSFDVAASRYCGDTISEDTDDCETEELFGWKGWRELLLERQRAMEKHMHAQKRHINRREKEQLRVTNKERGGKRRGVRGGGDNTHTQTSNHLHSSTESDTEDEGTSKEEDPLGISPPVTTTKRSRPSEKKPNGATTATPRAPTSPQQQYAATSPSPAAASGNSFITARSSAPPMPTNPPFFGTSFPTPPFYPSWPPFYAAAVAAAAAARRAGEEAGMTGQERIQDLKKALEQAKQETKDYQEYQALSKLLHASQEARSRLEEGKKKHEQESEELKKQLAQLRETLEEREKELTVATAKHTEAEKQKKVLREEFDIMTRVHKDMKEEFQREKDTLLSEKASLQAKIEDLEKSIESSKDQLMVARESLVAARTKQLTATQAHEQDLKTLQAYRLEIETLREDVKYLQILNLSLSEKVRRFSASAQRQQHQQLHAQAAAAETAAGGRGGGRRSGIIAAHGRMAGCSQQQQRDFHQCAKHGIGNNTGSNMSTQRLPPQAMPTLQELLSPQLQQKLLRDRQNECRGAAACAPPLKEATFTLPSSLGSHGEPPASSPAALCSGDSAVALRAAAEGTPIETAVGGRATAGERRAVEHVGQEKAGRLLSHHHRLSFTTEKRDGTSDGACALDSTSARLRTASPTSQSFPRETDAAATGPSLPCVVEAAPRCRSLPITASAVSVAAAAPLRERDTQISRLANSIESEEEMRLARLCATVLAAHSEREQKRQSRAAGEMHASAAAAAGGSSSFRRASSSLFSMSPCPRVALHQHHSGDSAAAATPPEQQQCQQQPHYHQPQQQYLKKRESRSPPVARRAAADSPFEASTYACENREDYGVWSQSFDRKSSAIEDHPSVSSASLAAAAAAGAEERPTVLIPSLQERQLLSDASCVCTEKHGILSHVDDDEQCIMSEPSSHINGVETYVSGSYSFLQDERKPLRSDSCTKNAEKTASCHSRTNSSFARESRQCTSFMSSKKPPVSSVSYRSGQHRLLSHGSCAATDSHLFSAFNDRGENAPTAAAVDCSAAAARVDLRCRGHYTEGNTTTYHMQARGNTRADHASNVGGNPEREISEESKTTGSSNRICNRKDEADKEVADRDSENHRKEVDAVQRSDRNAEDDVLHHVGIHRNGRHLSSHNKGERTCNGSGIVNNSEENLPNRRVFVPGLALNGVSPSISCTVDRAKTASSSNSSLCTGPNSARTQWLLNRVARISRLQGLQNIHEKLKDLPPALIAASDSARRSSQEREAHKAASNNSSDNSSNDGGSSNGRKVDDASRTDV